MASIDRRVALITGSSRGIGAETALALAQRGYDIVITYRNKAARAEAVARQVKAHGVSSLTVACDITRSEEVTQLASRVGKWVDKLDILVLNASGGLERDRFASDPSYPRRINRDAQLSVLDAILPFLGQGSTVVFVTSHWAHLYGQVEQLPAYGPVAESKWAGEQALRARQGQLTDQGIRLLVATGDLIADTITPKLLERAAPGLTAQRQSILGDLPTATDMGEAIAQAAIDADLPTGHTVVIGGEPSSLT